MSHGRRGQSPIHQAGVRPGLWADKAGDPELLSILVSSPARPGQRACDLEHFSWFWLKSSSRPVEKASGPLSASGLAHLQHQPPVPSALPQQGRWRYRLWIRQRG